MSSIISDHLMISLQIDFEDSPQNFLFKFNHHWMEDMAFQIVVKDFWCKEFGDGDLSDMDLMTKN